MAKQRVVNTKFWDDTYVSSLSPIEKLVFLYVLTNPLTDLCGAYEITLKRIASDTGIKGNRVLEILEHFEKAGKVIYRDGWMIVRNFTKHQVNNPKVSKGIERALNDCPDWVKDSLSKPMIDHRTLTLTCRDNLDLKGKPSGGAADAARPPEPVPELESEPEPETKPADPRKVHPAIIGIHEVTGKDPPRELWDELIDTMGADIDLVQLKRCWVQWRARGFKPMNYAWALEWYRDGIPDLKQRNGTNRRHQQQTGTQTAGERILNRRYRNTG